MDIIKDLVERINDTHAEIVATERMRHDLYRIHTSEGYPREENDGQIFRQLEERLEALWEQKRMLLAALARQSGLLSVDPARVIYRHSRRKLSKRGETKRAA